MANKKNSRIVSFFKDVRCYTLLACILIVFLGVDISMHISNSIIDNQNIVLTFVGILATFVVVSNYMQVKEIENKFNTTVEAAKEGLQKQFEDKIATVEFRMEHDVIHKLAACFFDAKHFSVALVCYTISLGNSIASEDEGEIKDDLNSVEECIEKCTVIIDKNALLGLLDVLEKTGKYGIVPSLIKKIESIPEADTITN
jgi:hypothetical protein